MPGYTLGTESEYENYVTWGMSIRTKTRVTRDQKEDVTTGLLERRNMNPGLLRLVGHR